jgi:prephenate dehydrogenase
MKTLNDADLTIVGAGLMGASLALALRGTVRTIRAVDTDPASREIVAAYVDEVSGDLDPAVAAADVIVLATPIRAILRLLDHLKTPGVLRPGAVVIDLGSVKQQIVQAMDDLPETVLAVGGHPMCGKETSGPQDATGALYQGSVFVLCPSRRTTDEVLAFATGLIRAIGARPLILPAARHDAAVAAISHLPYVLSAGLVSAVDRGAENDPLAWTLASNGFRDTSRLAAGDVTMMSDILLTNQNAILDALALFRAQLDALETAIRSSDEAALRGILGRARQVRIDWFKKWSAPSE